MAAKRGGKGWVVWVEFEMVTRMPIMRVVKSTTAFLILCSLHSNLVGLQVTRL